MSFLHSNLACLICGRARFCLENLAGMMFERRIISGGQILRKRMMLIGGVSWVFIIGPGEGAAQTTRTWDGGWFTSNWSTSFFGFDGYNWNPNTNPVAGDHLTFAGNSRTTNNNNYSSGTAFGNITFAAGAATFRLDGNSITLNGGVANNSANVQAVNLDLILPGVRVLNAAQGNLVVDGDISGVGGIVKEGVNTLTLSGSNTYTGTTTVNAGTLRAGSTQSFGVNSAVALSTSGGSVLDLNGFSNSLGSLSGGGSVNFTGSNLTIGGLGTSTVYAGNLSGAGGGLVKAGGGILTLEGTNTYTGTTTVTGGTLVINGDHGGATGAIIIDEGATLSGNGVIGGNVTIEGVHRPGNSPGVATHFGDLTYTDGSALEWDLTRNEASTSLQSGPTFYFDQVSVAGNLNFSGATTMNFNFNTSSAVNWNDSFWDMWSVRDWLVYEVGGTISNFGNLSLGNPSSWIDSTGESFAAALGGDLPSSANFYLYQSESNIFLRYEAVPEPAGFSLLALILGVVTMMARPRRQVAA